MQSDTPQAKHYRANREQYLERNRRRRKEAVDAIKAAKSGRRCWDCDKMYPYYVMDFHHRDPSTKIAEVGKLANRGVKAVLREIEKCDLVCANCHRIRTYGNGC